MIHVKTAVQGNHLVGGADPDDDLHRLVTEVAAIAAQDESGPGRLVPQAARQQTLNEILRVVRLGEDFDSLPQA